MNFIPNRRRAGVTLVELMITMAIMSIGVLAAIGSYRYISVSIQNSKARTLSNNLAQEQIEKLKNLSYYMLLVTTNTASYAGLTGVDYDTGNYPPATFVEGGVSFTRATRVDFAYQNGTAISTAPWTTNDTGLKLITTFVIWRDANGLQHQSMRNLHANPAANPLNGSFTGIVRDSVTNAPLPGALIQVVDNPNWYAMTNSAGVYQFNVSQGSYTLQCSSHGFFTTTTPNYLSINSNQVYTQNFSLGRMSSGTAVGYVYINDHLVVSQVVGSTTNATTGFNQEYVELFNPTTYTWAIAANATTPLINLYYQRRGNSLVTITMTYNTLTIAPGRYYLFANTTTVTAVGVSRTADAVFNTSNPGYPNIIEINTDPGNDAAGVAIGFVSGGSYIDQMGWKKSGNNSPLFEANPLNEAIGLEDDEQYVRRTAPGSVTSTHGRAYDANDNENDFDTSGRQPMVHPPRNSTDSGTIVTGTPAIGAYITLSDTLSRTETCNSALVGGQIVCQFNVPSIATGTWTMITSSGTYYKETTNVVIAANVSTGVPNGSTLSSWTVSGVSNTLLNNTTSYAFLSGIVTNASNAPLAGIIIGAGGRTSATSSSGRYFLSVPAGDIQIVANYGNANRAYTSQTTSVMAVSAGLLYDAPTSTHFKLSLGGILSGYFQTGSLTPLPGRVANALLGGNVAGSGVSQSDGHFYISNVSTGIYTITPALDPAETSSPSSISITLSSTGTTTTVSTFTITSGLSEITGQVLASSVAIKTGVLVLASTATLSGGATTPPPTQDGWTGMLCDPCTYAGSSDSTGVYSIYVRSSTTPYKLYGWYTTFTGTTPTVARRGPYTVNVSTAGQIISQSLSW